MTVSQLKLFTAQLLVDKNADSVNLLNIIRVAQHADQKQFQKIVRDLTRK